MLVVSSKVVLHVRFLCLALPFIYAALCLAYQPGITCNIQDSTSQALSYILLALRHRSGCTTFTAVATSKLLLCATVAPVACTVLSSQPAASLCSDPHSTRKDGSYNKNTTIFTKLNPTQWLINVNSI